MGNIRNIIDNIQTIPYDRLTDPKVLNEITQHAVETRNSDLYGKLHARTCFEPQSDIERELLELYNADKQAEVNKIERRKSLPTSRITALANAEYTPESVTGFRRRLTELRGADPRFVTEKFNTMNSVDLKIYYFETILMVKSFQS